MNIEEMLTSAAKAVKYSPIRWHPPTGNWDNKHGWLEIGKPESLLGNCIWRPHSDGGDAVELAVKLNINIVEWLSGEPKKVHGCMAYQTGCAGCFEPYGDDPIRATCLAITRVAAKVGDTLP